MDRGHGPQMHHHCTGNGRVQGGGRGRSDRVRHALVAMKDSEGSGDGTNYRAIVRKRVLGVWLGGQGGGGWAIGASAPARVMDTRASQGDKMNNYNYVPRKIVTKVRLESEQGALWR